MARPRKPRTEIVSAAKGGDAMALGGLEGAQRTSRETATWVAPMRAPDAIINTVKREADARGFDMSINDGFASGALATHRDSIVGNEYRLNAMPNWRALGVSEEWAEEWSEVVEARFHAIAESPFCWLDASGTKTFTDMIRLAIAGYVMTGECVSTAEWLTNNPLRPLRTCAQIVSPDRLSNPYDNADTETIRRGVERNRDGMPVAYHIRMSHPGDGLYVSGDRAYKWKRVRAYTGWGRWQCLHIMEQRLPDQSRGVAEMVAVLKQMRMAKRFSEITLQNAVVNATYAAAIESELPSDSIIAAMGGGQGGAQEALMWYMSALASYLTDANNIAIDGVKIPHLFPGTKFKLQPAGTPGGIGTDFESGLLRKIAAGLGMSYEEFSRDYSKTNYSSARAGMLATWKGMQSKKRIVADRLASAIYMNVVEEEISAGNLPLPPGKRRSWFYEPLVRESLCRATWIGAARGQIDEMKETQAAVLRVSNNLSTLEAECARVGLDWRDVLRQRAREAKLMKELGLDQMMQPQKPNPLSGRPSNDDGDAEQREGEDA